MTRIMTKLTLASMAGVLALGLSAPFAQAQPKGQQIPPGCVLLPNGKLQCNNASGKQAVPAIQNRDQNTVRQQNRQQNKVQAHVMPRIGASAKGAPIFQQAKISRLPKPPAHQHYRVLDGTIVRVDSDTLKVIAVMGLMSDLMK
ncbi:hypothetical protein [Paenirhodobacter sp. CAU 1674]|uniref:hypothetical protein n=1 Tax=Paenirhodobacter sp. CAU 1674 TaxID=3032596 RepID=UPI0023DBC916|nr:hypothetical protein [Paenirhodobacter sp. CAU 1674]MDF2142700.1 hypothetical protein [Paenirhodobacter sp. CAU 1674]